MKTLKMILAIIGWVLAAVVALSFIMMIASVSMMAREMLADNGASSGIDSGRAVSVVSLVGEILSSKKFKKNLKKQVENKKIKAIVVRIDSPGGAVGASEEIYQSILRARDKKPIVCSLGNIAASGGLYASLGCSKVVTNESTISGSIGVVMMIPNVSGIMKEFGVDMTVIKSGVYKDAGSPFRKVTLEDKSILQSTVDQAYEQFVAAISKARDIDVEEVKKFADGRIILGETAVQLKLADSIGTLEDAAKIALELAGVEGEPEIIIPKDRQGFRAIFDDIADSRVLSLLRSMDQVQLLYRAFV